MNIVENFDLFAPRLINKKELLSPGHRACSGCAEVLAVRLMCKALGENTVIASATGCMEIVSSMFPTTAWDVPWIHVAFENAASVASGMEAGLKALRKKGKIDDRYVKVVGMGGDGATMDIGFQALSGAMERGHDTGKNFWTVGPTLALMYFGQENGIEASLFIGADFNEENPDTDYESGTQGHLDGTLSQHFPFAGGVAGVGVSGYYYEQLTADRGDGATFGDFEAKTVGAGPVISWITKAGCSDLIAELKWLHEFDTERRLEGDTVFLKVLYKFY